MKKLIFIILTVISFFSVSAQNHTPSATGADGLSMGGMRVVANDVYSVFGNQAGLAQLETTSFSVFGENRFALANINQFSAGVGIPTSAGTFGLGLQYFGFEDYNEQKVSIAYARKLAKRFSIGAAVDYLNFRIPIEGNQGNITFELGLQGEVTDQITLGVLIFSPVTISWTENDVVPTIFALGGSYQPTDKIRIIAEVEKDFELPVNFKAGLEYRLIEVLAVRVGVNTYPIQNSFGLGIFLKNLQIDVAAVYHQVLGVTTGFSVKYDLGE